MSNATGSSPVSRRDFLRVGGLVVGLKFSGQIVRAKELADRRRCIFLVLTGGPSQFETFDPKPNAPVEFRGPLKPISTAIPGVSFSEALPRLAERADRLAVIRSLHHSAAPIHETGLQMLQTGHLSNRRLQFPSFGSLVANSLGMKSKLPSGVILPGYLKDTGVNSYRGDSAGFLSRDFDPVAADELDDAQVDPICKALDVSDEKHGLVQSYGHSTFGQNCLRARRLVQAGVRTVTVNMYQSLEGQKTWDCHGDPNSAPATVFDVRDTIAPTFDQALGALLDDLESRGLLEDTLVVAVGEMGRSPKINERRGRDHSTTCWSGVLAGAGIRGGQVIGASDKHGRLPADKPVDLRQITATAYERIGLDPSVSIEFEGEELPVCEAAPLELSA